MEDKDAQVRRDAVLAVAKLKSPGVAITERLRSMSQADADPSTRDLSAKAIARIEK